MVIERLQSVSVASGWLAYSPKYLDGPIASKTNQGLAKRPDQDRFESHRNPLAQPAFGLSHAYFKEKTEQLNQFLTQVQERFFQAGPRNRDVFGAHGLFEEINPFVAVIKPEDNQPLFDRLVNLDPVQNHSKKHFKVMLYPGEYNQLANGTGAHYALNRFANPYRFRRELDGSLTQLEQRFDFSHFCRVNPKPRRFKYRQESSNRDLAKLIITTLTKGQLYDAGFNQTHGHHTLFLTHRFSKPVGGFFRKNPQDGGNPLNNVLLRLKYRPNDQRPQDPIRVELASFAPISDHADILRPPASHLPDEAHEPIHRFHLPQTADSHDPVLTFANHA